MTISVCIASRGRPELLSKTVAELARLAELPETRISIALDDDDAGGYDLSAVVSERTHVSVFPREDSLGEKYNRAAACYRADVYVLWADDVITATQGWDKKIADAAALFTDGIGIVYFGKIEGVLQPGIAVTQKMVDAMGFFCVPYFPFWWHDTWIDEIGRMTDRIAHADVQMELLQGLAGKSRGVREIAFWAKFFDDTRFSRRRVAQHIINIGDDQPFRKQQLRARLTAVEQFVHQRNKKCSDPASAAQLEKHYSFDAPSDERYERLKAATTEVMNKLKAEAF